MQVFSNSIKGNKFFKFSLGLLILYIYLDYILTYTVFKSQILIYIMMITNLLTIGYCFISCKHNTINISSIWLPFIVYHILSLTVSGNISTIPYWLVCIMIMYMPVAFYDNFSPRIFVAISIFFTIGIIFQVLLPSAYYSYIYPLFIADASEFVQSSIDNEFGFSGFSYQTGSAACGILIGEITCLSFGKSILPKHIQALYPILVALFIIAVFLTGKRMPSILAIILLIVSFYLNTQSSTKKVLITVILITIICLGYNYFVVNLDAFSDSIFLKRFVSSYEDINVGGDISSGRTELYDKAWEYFYDNPILGIGAGNYAKISGMDTSVHNVYLQVLCEEGVVGLIFYIIPLIVIFLKTWRLHSNSQSKRSIHLLSFSLLIQLYYILYSMTGNCIVEINNFVLYFLGVTMYFYANIVRNRNLNYNYDEYSILHK